MKCIKTNHKYAKQCGDKPKIATCHDGNRCGKSITN